MPYILSGGDERRRRGADDAPPGGLGCGAGCRCRECRTRDPLGEWYVREPASENIGWFGEAPASAPPLRACPIGPRMATDRCGIPQPCPAVPTLICVRGVGGVPFEYVDRVTTDPATGLRVPTHRIPNREQRFVPQVQQALQRFLVDMQQNGLPVDAILTAGSLYCRCITGMNRLSNHSFGDAIDIVGVRWGGGRIPGRLRETIVHNFLDPVERSVLRRINAMLRLAFATVIDYHRSDHRDHFHCDTNLGRGRLARGTSTIAFVQEALNVLMGRGLPENGRLDEPTRRALVEFARGDASILTDTTALNATIDRLFRQIASGAGVEARAGATAGAAAASPRAPVPPAAPGDRLRPAPRGTAIDGRRMLLDAIGRGITDVNQLTNLLFHARHPQRGGRSITRAEPVLAAEWLAVRDRIVRPELAQRSAAVP